MAHAHRHGSRSAGGLTLLDVTLVVLIASILGSIGIPMIGSALIGYRLSAAADEMTSALEYARALALASHCETRVTFDVAADSLVVERAAASIDLALASGTTLNEADVEGWSFQPVEHPLNRGFDYTLSQGSQGWPDRVDLTLAQFGPDSEVVFQSDGTPLSGGTVHLVHAGRTLVLTVDKQTGRVSLP